MTTLAVPPDAAVDPLQCELPPELEAGAPAEARGLARDAVRLLVSNGPSGALSHHLFHELPELLDPGDLLVINTSGTLAAPITAGRADGTPLAVHVSSRLPGGLCSVELRLRLGDATVPFRYGVPGERLALLHGGACTLHQPYRSSTGQVSDRLWLASFDLPCPLDTYLERHGSPIRYSYARGIWPLSAYQTVYATEPGSAEMPSAGRPFTPEVLTRLVSRGIVVAPLLLHTGVASLESGEPPYEEYSRVPQATADLVNTTRAAGRRVLAVGTTVIRALETVTDTAGRTHPGEGWTALVIEPRRPIRALDGLLTGLHEPRSTHLAMLEALVGRVHLEHAYAELLRMRYLWHEFGDLHLLLR